MRGRSVQTDSQKTGLTAPDTLLDRLLGLRQAVVQDAQVMIDRWTADIEPEREHVRPSIQNLAHYVALRRHDLRDIQDRLRPWGLSSLGRIEAQVLPNLDAVINTLAQLTGTVINDLPERPTMKNFEHGSQLLQGETEVILGAEPAKRRVRIMVTLPTHAADDPVFVEKLVEHGMNIARINCAHDSANTWKKMIANVKEAEAKTGKSCKIAMDLGGPKSRTADILKKKKKRIKQGDIILLTEKKPEKSNKYKIQVRCTLPQVLGQVKIGDHVWFDDGKIGTKTVEHVEEGIVLEVIQASRKGDNLKEDKGINFPNTGIVLAALTEKDLEDLDFVVQHADIINYSFVQTASDIEQLQAAIAERKPKRDIALIAKIETGLGVKNLPELIASASSKQPFGVMIARGDLAVELGFQRLAEMQEEILWMSEAAHVPVIWATQVLETLAKRGRPSRAEVTDAAMSERAECVMLNKGEYIIEALDILEDILVRMHRHQSKKVARLRALRSW